MVRVFYSWQSDTPSKTGHYLIRDALELALERLAEDLALDEAERPELDHDTKGVPGAPPIMETILTKIEKSDVFVADVTLTGKTENDKPVINSNVAIELGYALKAKGDGALLLIMNTAQGTAENLPFDLRHRRWPVTFSLAPDADKKVCATTRDKLAGALVPILKAHVDGANQSAVPPQETASTVSPAHYWQPGEVLVPPDRDRGWGELRCDKDALLFLRMWPKTALPQLTEHQASILLLENQVRSLRREFDGYSDARNRYGGIVYASDREAGQVLSATQLFRSREIWGFDATCLSRVERSSDGEKFPILPIDICERILVDGLRRYLTCAREALGYPAGAIIEAGASNIHGFQLKMTDGFGNNFLPIYRQHIMKRAVLDDWSDEAVDSVLLSVFEEFFDAAGVPRPANYAGFPQGAIGSIRQARPFL
jgi:hypothetical protein